MMHRLIAFALLAALALASSCGFPSRTAWTAQTHGELQPIRGFEDVRAIDGYPNAAFQEAFDEAIRKLMKRRPVVEGRRRFEMLVLSSGGVNGAFGAGVLTAWSKRGDRPVFDTVTGVSVGALMAPFAFAGQRFDARLEELFRRIDPADMHAPKGMLNSVLWDESLMDNRPLRRMIADGVDDELMRAVAEGHAEGRRLMVGTTNLDMGEFVVWDLGAIASRGTKEARDLFVRVLTASASIPVVYPPVRFRHDKRDELHADGAVIRPLFMPQNIFDGYLSAERAGLNWDDVDCKMYVIQNGSLRPRPADVQRDTLAIALRTVTMMSYTMVSEHVLHLYMLARAWKAEFRFVSMPDGLELDVEAFTANDTERLFLLGAGLIENKRAWLRAPPGYVLRQDLAKIQPISTTSSNPSEEAAPATTAEELRALRSEIRALRDEVRGMQRRR